MKSCKIWIDQCKAARGIKDDFGTDKALAYLIDSKFLSFLEAAETDAEFRAEIPGFVAEIKTIFERWQLAECLEHVRHTEPFALRLYYEGANPEESEIDRRQDLSRCAPHLLLVERAKEWLLEEGTD